MHETEEQRKRRLRREGGNSVPQNSLSDLSNPLNQTSPLLYSGFGGIDYSSPSTDPSPPMDCGSNYDSGGCSDGGGD
jgi:hypothetical protein